MNRSIQGPLAALFALALGACTVMLDEPASPPVEFPAAPLERLTSRGNSLVVEVRTGPEQPPQHGTIHVELIVRDTTGRTRDDLTLDVVPWMPTMGHGSPEVAQVEARGGGKYVVTNVNLFMPGRWQLRTAVGGALQDSLDVELDVP